MSGLQHRAFVVAGQNRATSQCVSRLTKRKQINAGRYRWRSSRMDGTDVLFRGQTEVAWPVAYYDLLAIGKDRLQLDTIHPTYPACGTAAGSSMLWGL